MAGRWLEHAREGGSVPEFCRNERICKTAFYQYCQRYPTMMEARVTGKVWAEGWWIQQARDYLVTHSSKEEGSTNFNVSLYKWIMAGRFGHNDDKNSYDMLQDIYKRLEEKIASPMNAIAVDAECYQLETDVKELQHDNQVK